MTETLAAVPPADDDKSTDAEQVDVTPEVTDSPPEESLPPLTVTPSERAVLANIVRAARSRGDELTGPDGLLKLFTKTALEIALDEEMSEHLGYDKHAVAGHGSGNSRNGTRTKTVLTDNAGPVDIQVPRDRDASFEPIIVRKRQRRLGDVDTVVLSLYAKGLTTGEISAHFAEVYGASLSKDRISVITDRVIEEMSEWCNRPLLPVYAAIFIDAIYVKVRDGQVGNRPFYAAIGVDLHGHRDVLGLWAGTAGHGESAKFWMSVLAEIKNRGVSDVFFIVCDGLKGLPDSANAVFPLATIQTSSMHDGCGEMVSLVGCAVTGRTDANELPSRSTCRPVHPWRGRLDTIGQREQHLPIARIECRDEVPDRRASHAMAHRRPTLRKEQHGHHHQLRRRDGHVRRHRLGRDATSDLRC